jgi:hypothetical protein
LEQPGKGEKKKGIVAAWVVGPVDFTCKKGIVAAWAVGPVDFTYKMNCFVYFVVAGYVIWTNTRGNKNGQKI